MPGHAFAMEELFVRQVDIGVADMDISVDDQLTSARVVVERATATDRHGGPDRELLLVYGAEETRAVADALRRASDVAMSDTR
jgi:MOSC domain-containing protein YiiM